MAKLFNRAKMTTSTTGSGTVTLDSASVGYQSFADAGVSNGDVVQYVIEEGANFEIGTGTYSATGTSLTRSPTESSNSNAAISLSGAATVSITAVADDLNRLQHEGSTKVEPSATGATVTGNLAVTGTVDGRDVSADGSKLDGIESGATADQTAAEIRSLVESATDSNVFTDADHTKLNGIESGATADQTASEILTAIKTVDGSGSGLDADTLDGNHASAFALSGHNHTYDVNNAWLRDNGDNANVKLYGNSRQMVFRTDGTTEYSSGVGGYPFAWMYGGDTSSSRRMLLNSSGDLWTTTNGWLSTALAGKLSTSGKAADSELLDGIDSGSFVRSDASDTLGGATYTFSSTTNQKIILQGSSSPYIRFQEGTTDRGYIQWASGDNALKFQNQESDYFDFYTHDGAGATNIRLKGSDNDTWGSVYASENGGNHSIGLLDGDQNWAYRHTKDTDHAWYINNVTEMSLNSSELNLSGNNINNVTNMYVGNAIYHYGDTDTNIWFGTDQMVLATGGSSEVTINSTGVRLGDTGNGYFQPVSSQYGSVQIDGGAHGGWEGYNIGGRVVFMHDNGSGTGIYNDVNNHWLFYGVHGSYTRLYHSGSHKLETTSTGVTVTGDLNSTSDIRYKKNIETIDNALEKVQSLRGVTFDWDHEDFNSDSRATGVIAQDVEKVLPEAVSENEDGFKNVAYGNMVGLLIEAIKEQQEQIDALKAQLNG